MINRAAIMLKYKSPAIDWINSIEPSSDTPRFTLGDVNQERTIYLIRDEDADSPDIVNRWIKLNFRILFENELFGWYIDEDLWPKKRTLQVFKQWFEIETHTVIWDLVGEPIVSNDA